LTAGFVRALPVGAVLGATVKLEVNEGHAHAISAWFGAAQGHDQRLGRVDGVDFCVPGDVSMERSCQVAYLWWKLNRPHLLKVGRRV
jgi:hypothetical protein